MLVVWFVLRVHRALPRLRENGIPQNSEPDRRAAGTPKKVMSRDEDRGRPRCGPPEPLIRCAMGRRWCARARAKPYEGSPAQTMRQSRMAHPKLRCLMEATPLAQRGAQPLARTP